MKPSAETDEKAVAPTVYVVDDDSSMREALSSLVRSIDLNVETLSSAKEFLRRKRPKVPACLVLDVRMAGMSGLELQRELATAKDPIPIIFITAHGDIPMTVRAMKAGAVEFLPKPFKEQDLLDAIHLAIERDREALRQRAVAAELLAAAGREGNSAFSKSHPPSAQRVKLTPREKEILLLMVKGCIKKEIADHFSLSFHTVNNHERRIYRKLKVHTRSAAVAKAMRDGLCIEGVIKNRRSAGTD
jgi:FixJ family two-component response regulator